jgi:hypothetical protein
LVLNASIELQRLDDHGDGDCAMTGSKAGSKKEIIFISQWLAASMIGNRRP